MSSEFKEEKERLGKSSANQFFLINVTRSSIYPKLVIIISVLSSSGGTEFVRVS